MKTLLNFINNCFNDYLQLVSKYLIFSLDINENTKNFNLFMNILFYKNLDNLNKKLHQFLNSNEDNEHILFVLGCTYIILGKYDISIKYFDSAIKLINQKPGNINYINNNLAYSYFLNKINENEMIRLFEHSFWNGYYISAHNLALYYINVKSNYDNSRELYSRTIYFKYEEGKSYYNIGIILFNQFRSSLNNEESPFIIADILTMFELALINKFYLAYYSIGYVYYVIKNYEKSFEYFDKFLGSDNSTYIYINQMINDTYYYMAKMYIDLYKIHIKNEQFNEHENWMNVIKEYLTKASETNMNAMYELGIFYERKRMYRESSECFMKSERQGCQLAIQKNRNDFNSLFESSDE